MIKSGTLCTEPWRNPTYIYTLAVLQDDVLTAVFSPSYIHCVINTNLPTTPARLSISGATLSMVVVLFRLPSQNRRMHGRASSDPLGYFTGHASARTWISYSSLAFLHPNAYLYALIISAVSYDAWFLFW